MRHAGMAILIITAPRVTLTAGSTTVPPERLAPGGLAFPGRVIMHPAHPSGMLSTPESARRIGVTPATIRKWRQRGWLKRQGLDERGRPLHTVEALKAAEELVRRHGIEASGIDPRRLRTGAVQAA